MGLGLRRRFCGRGWGRAPAPPSSAEGERCGCPGPRLETGDGLWWGEGSSAALEGENGAEEGAGEERRDSGRRVCSAGVVDSCQEGHCGVVAGNGTPVGGETPGGAGNEVLESEKLLRG